MIGVANYAFGESLMNQAQRNSFETNNSESSNFIDAIPKA